MNLIRIITDPAILIIIGTFLSMGYYTYKQYTNVNKNLLWFKAFLSKYKKSDLTFRFGEFDAAISKVKYTSRGIEIILHDKLKALELLGKYLGLFKDKVEIEDVGNSDWFKEEAK